MAEEVPHPTLSGVHRKDVSGEEVEESKDMDLSNRLQI
jgi:hypothetical protein